MTQSLAGVSLAAGDAGAGAAAFLASGTIVATVLTGLGLAGATIFATRRFFWAGALCMVGSSAATDLGAAEIAAVVVTDGWAGFWAVATGSVGTL